MPKNLVHFILVSLLGFISGLPLMLLSSTLQAWGTNKGLNLMTLGFLTFIGMPYAYKFLWSPLLDRYRIPLWKGQRRGWILSMATMTSISLFLLSLTELPHDLTWFVACATITTFFSATLDIAIDAYRIEYLAQKDYGLGNACFISAYRVAMLMSGGLALIIADQIGWHLTYLIMGCLMLLGAILLFFAPEPLPKNAHHVPSNWLASIINPLKELTSYKNIYLILLFVLLYKFGEALSTALISTFLLRELHFSLTIIGGVYKTIGLIATILGAFVGGYLYRRLTMYQSLMYFGILQALGVLFFVWLSESGQNIPLMVTAIGIEALTAGMSTTVFLAFLMRLCHPNFTATQFALLSALASVGRIFTGPLASLLIKDFNWTTYFIISFLVCWPSLVVLRMLKKSLKNGFFENESR